MNKKVLIAVSSTGGHIYPGLAIADELKKNGYDVFFVGKKSEIIAKENYRFYNISDVGFPRKHAGASSRLLKIIPFFLKLLCSIIQSIKILVKEKPDIIIGFGGYVSFPVVLSAWVMRTRCIIHEQNFIPGLANKLSARFSDKICVSFEESKKYFASPKAKAKVVYTGNPLRQQILNIKPSLHPTPYTLLTCFIFGGSQGSHSMNLAVINSIEKFSGIKEKICFIHITGDNDYEIVKNAYTEKGLTAEVHKYIHNIETAYQKASLVVCRAGATTIAELISLKLPAVLVPYPYSAEGHQKANADYLGRLGAAVVLEEKEIKRLPDIILELINQPQTLRNISDECKKLPDSRPVQILSELVEKISCQ